MLETSAPFIIDGITYVTDPTAHIEVGDRFVMRSVSTPYAVFECLDSNELAQDTREYYEQENMIYAKSTDVDYFFGTERKHCYKIINEL